MINVILRNNDNYPGNAIWIWHSSPVVEEDVSVIISAAPADTKLFSLDNIVDTQSTAGAGGPN